MSQAKAAFLLARRDPARYLAFTLAVFSIFLFEAAPPPSSFWIALMVAPVFLIAAALAVPNFSPFELAMPLTATQLVWSRVLASLTIVWLPLLTGIPAMLVMGHPLAAARQPLELALLFTASACLATTARATSRRSVELVSALLALASWILAAQCIPWQAGLALTGVAALPVMARLWWTHAPEWNWPAIPRFNFFWPPLRLIWSWQTMLWMPIMVWFGMDVSWSLLVFVGFFAKTDAISSRFVLGLPISRRHILGALLAPLVVSFAAGVALSNRFNAALDDSERIANFTQPSPQATWREFYGNPPGLLIPPYYYRQSPTAKPPMVTAPWGETTQPLGSELGSTLGPSKLFYDPYFVAPDNSDRFFEWQFARATREIYGAPLRPEELRHAILAGLRPVAQQPRMQVLRLAFGIACLLVMAFHSALADWYRLRAIPRVARTLVPFLLPICIVLGAQFCIPYQSISFVQGGLLHLSAVLPSNPALLIATLLAALAPLYGALETVFNQVEFPDKSKETE